jgi:hypothetical protein
MIEDKRAPQEIQAMRLRCTNGPPGIQNNADPNGRGLAA